MKKTGNGTNSDIEPNELVSLLHAVSTGDRLAFKSLYEHCSMPLFRVLLRILKKEPIAQDALQEVFVKIWQRSEQYDHTLAPPMAWMSRIAKNQAIDMLRNRQVRIDLELDSGADMVDNLVDLSTNAQLLDDNASSLVHCLEQLEPNPRLCIVRAYCEGYSHEELSAQTGAPLGTVKSWIRRSLVALRRCLESLDE